MKPELKVEGDKLKISTGVSTGVDSDKDGEYAVKISGNFELELDGSEVVDELVKSSSLVAKFKAKLGL